MCYVIRMLNNEDLIYRALTVCPSARLELLKRTESVYAFYLREDISHYPHCWDLLNQLSAMRDEGYEHIGYNFATFNPSI